MSTKTQSTLREPAETRYADELAALATADQHPRPETPCRHAFTP